MTNPLKIVWITQRFAPLTGGMAVSAARQVTALRRAGMIVDVFIFLSGQKEAIHIQRKPVDNGTNFFVSHPDMWGNAAQRAWREILFQSVKAPYDLALGFGAGFPGFAAVTFAAWLKIPAMVSVRGNDFDTDWFEIKRTAWVNESLGRADAIAAVSLEKKEKITALFPRAHVFWAPNGIDADQYELLPSEQNAAHELRDALGAPEKRIFGIFGELKYKKRIPFWLSAVRDARVMDKISLVAAGKMDEKTRAVLNDPVLSPQCRHFEFQDQAALPGLYAACDFIVLPSLFEGFPNALLEGMAAGCIPVVSDAGAMKDIISHGQNGFIFETENNQSAQQAVTDALSMGDPTLMEMKARVQNQVRERFSLENEIGILTAEINRLTAHKPG